LLKIKKNSWDDIRQVYEIDKKSNTTRALNKISDIHLNPNAFQKMRVKYATQIFSHTMSSALYTAVQLKQITTDSATDTAKFIENMNNIFDALNSRHFLDRNKNKRLLSLFNKNPEDILKEGKKVISKHKTYVAKFKTKV
jgi:phosphomevalonate kinase